VEELCEERIRHEFLKTAQEGARRVGVATYLEVEGMAALPIRIIAGARYILVEARGLSIKKPLLRFPSKSS